MSESNRPLDLFQQAEALRALARKARFDIAQTAHADRLDAMAQQLEEGGIKNAIEANLESHKTKNAQWLEQMSTHAQWFVENDKAVLNLSQAAVRTLVLINAGAAIALLSFIANIWQKGTDVSPFVTSLAWFSSGVAVATLTATLSYFTQLLYGSREAEIVSRGQRLHYASAAAGLLSLFIFTGGCVVSYKAFDARPVAVSAADEPLQKNFPPPKSPPPQPQAPAVPLPGTPAQSTPIKNP